MMNDNGGRRRRQWQKKYFFYRNSTNQTNERTLNFMKNIFLFTYTSFIIGTTILHLIYNCDKLSTCFLFYSISSNISIHSFRTFHSVGSANSINRKFYWWCISLWSYIFVFCCLHFRPLENRRKPCLLLIIFIVFRRCFH